jgi:predicted MFS family arabinose efflux permease
MLLQAGQAVAGPTWQALVPLVVGEDEVGQAISATQILFTIASLGGAPLGGFLSSLSGKTIPLILDAITFLGLAIVGWAVQTRRGGPADAVLTRLPSASHSTGLRFLRNDPLLARLIFMLLFFVIVGEAVNVAEVFLARDVAGATTTQYGFLGLLLGAGVIVGSILAGRIHDSPMRIIAIVTGVTVLSASFLVAGLWPIIATMAVTQSLGGVGQGILNTSISTLLITRVPDSIRGQVGASLNGLARSSSILALTLGGVLVRLIGAKGVFITCGIGGLAVIVLLSPSVMTLRHHTTQTQSP